MQPADICLLSDRLHLGLNFGIKIGLQGSAICFCALRFILPLPLVFFITARFRNACDRLRRAVCRPVFLLFTG